MSFPPRGRFLVFLLISSLVLSGVEVAAEEQDALSLPLLLEELRRANPDLAAARKRLEAAQARIPLARGLPAPRIGVEFEEIPRGTVRIDKASIMFGLIQSLPFPGKLSLRQQVALKEAQVAAVGFKQAEWEMTTQLKSVYYDLYLLDRELELQGERILWLEQAESSALARYAAVTGPQSDLLMAQGILLEAENLQSVFRHRRQAMEAHLNHLLNRPADAAAGNPGPLHLAEVPSSPADLTARAEEHQPDLLVFRYSAERAEAAWKLSKRELLPDLETMFKLRDPAAGPIGPWDMTLALVLPFWFWTKQKYGVKAALFDKESAEAAYQAARNMIARRIHENWHEAQGAYETARLCRDRLLPLTEQAVSSSLAGYQAGLGSFMDLTRNLASWTEQKRTYVEHLVVLEQRIVTLEQAVGAPLREWHQERTGHPSTELRVTGHGELVEP